MKQVKSQNAKVKMQIEKVENQNAKCKLKNVKRENRREVWEKAFTGLRTVR
jgi:hypothetical protein